MRKIKFRLSALICIALISFDLLDAQSPFTGFRKFDFLDASELVLVSATYTNNQIQFKQSIFNLTSEGLVEVSSQIFDEAYSSSRQVDVATGDFNGDNKDDYVFAYAGADGTIQVYIPEINPATLEITGGNTLTIPGPISQTANELLGRIKLVVGDFDGDLQDEFIVTYAVPKSGPSEWPIHLDLFDTHGSLLPQAELNITAEETQTVFNGERMEVFDVVADDLDFDGDDEIVLAWGDNTSSTAYELFAKIITFDYNESYTWSAKGKRNLGFTANKDKMKGIYLSTGHLYHSVYPALIALTVAQGNETIEYESEVRTFEFIDNGLPADTDFKDSLKILFSGTYDLGWDQIAPIYNNRIPDVSLATGDFDGDGLDEFVIKEGVLLHLFRKMEEPSLSFSPTYISMVQEVSDVDINSNNGMVIADMDREVGLEIGIFQNDLEVIGYRMVIFKVSGDFQFTNFQEINSLIPPPPSTQGNYKYSIAEGDFDGDRLRLGAPEYHHISNILQPLVILNAPPIHFDNLDGINYDVNDCFGNNDCDFRAIYKYTQSASHAASATVFRDWVTSNNHSEGGGLFGLGIKQTITNTFGKNFAKTNQNNSAFEITNQVVAKGDDYIYATIINYDVWEFPVFLGDSLAGHVLDIGPSSIEPTWFQSKSWTGFGFVPNHEVGNVLSYIDYGNAEDNPFVDKEIKFANYSDHYGLGDNTSTSWSLLASDFEGVTDVSSYTISKSISRSGGFNLFGDFWDIGINMNSDENYSHGRINTHEVQVLNDLELTVNLGELDMSVGEVRYSVGPYAYWSNNGELYLNYVTRPETGQGVDTWWDTHYGNEQDPAFILPWRLDEEKGYTLQDPLKKYQTKSIQFSNPQPVVGDTITIYAIIHNFSLLPTEGNVKVSFYDGHPNEGGNILTDIHGNTFAETATFLQSRRAMGVAFKWVYPGSVDDFPKIFAYIDPDNEMTEIHEDNNIGFNILGVLNFNPDATQEPMEFVSDVLIYPNPASNIAVLEFTITQRTRTVVDLYNLNGQRIKTQVDQNLGPGTWQSFINCDDLPVGFYMASVRAGNQVKNVKLVVLR